MELYLKSMIRFIRCQMHINQDNTNENWLIYLQKVENILDRHFKMTISLRLLMNYLIGLFHKRKFIEKILEFQSKYVQKYIQDKNKKYKKLVDRLPYRDLSRNRFLLDLPNFSQKLKEEFLPLLLIAKDYMQKSLSILKGECLFFENGLKIEEILVCFSEICLLLREYRPRIRYNYVDIADLESKFRILKGQIDTNENLIEQQLIKSELSDLLDQKNLELEVFSYLNFAVQITEAKKEIIERFSNLGLIALNDPTRIPIDIYLEIIEQDYQYKKVKFI